MPKNGQHTFASRFRLRVEELSRNYGVKKRDYVDSFGSRDYEMERYGQEIHERFFDNNVGQGCSD